MAKKKQSKVAKKKVPGKVTKKKKKVTKKRAAAGKDVTELKDLTKEPVSAVQWVDRKNLHPNDYNPNKVAPPELELLIISILEDGWTQPIVVLPDMTIVDGFHRYTVSGDKRLMARYAGFVPIVMIKADPVHRKMSTIRHNRARGVHGVLPMAEIVAGMLKDGVKPEEIQQRLQMEDEEVIRLADRSGMRVRGAKNAEGFGRSFGPPEPPSKKKAKKKRSKK